MHQDTNRRTHPPDHSPQHDCPFCQRIAAQHGLLVETSQSVGFYDLTPLNPGHVLIVPRRHEEDFLALSADEHSSMLQVAALLRTRIDEMFRPDGFNLGVNIGESAGQTVAHSHLHLIPRYLGDVAEPRGGIRWLIPQRARYWEDDEQGGNNE